jgi:uncharacterized lipoprotein YmbA
MMKRDAVAGFFALISVVMLLSGCLSRSPSPSLYTLEAIPDVSAAKKDIVANLSLGIRQLTLPAIIQRPQIVLIEEERVLPLEQHRWSAPLETSMTQVLTEDLRSVLKTSSVLGYPWPPVFKPDYTLSISVSRFDGLPGGEVVLSGIYFLERTDAAKALLTDRFHIVEKVNGSDYAALVRGHSAAVSRLAQQIAELVTKD